MANSLTGHTKGSNEGLFDGSHILSPSFTNLYELGRGNGILLLEDAISDNSNRNTPANLSGAIATTGDAHIVNVKGGHVVLDNVLHNFCGGNGATANITISSGSANKNGSTTALTSGKECLFVVYLCSDGTNNAIKWEQGTPVTSASAYPLTPNSFLTDPSSSLTSKQSFVIATIRATHNSSAAGANDLNITISEINDKRGFVRPSPIYLAPLTGDSSASIDSSADLDNFHASANTETGDFTASSLGALWMSRGPDDSGQSETNDVLYFSGYQDGARRTFKLGPTKLVTVPSGGGTKTFTFDGGSLFRFTTNTATNLNPSGTFPSGHTITISNANSAGQANLTFDTTGLNEAVTPTSSTTFAYDADSSAWVRVFQGTTATGGSNGASTRLQISDGSGGFTSSANLTFNTSSNVLTLTGTADLNGLITDPTGIQFNDVTTNPGTGDTLWLDSDDSRLYHGSTKILMDGDVIPININGLSAGTIADGDFISFSDTNDSNTTKKEAIADVATLFAGTGLTASSSVINIDANQAGITSIGPAGTLTVNQDLTVTGNFTVNGTTTTVNSTTIQLDDKNIELGNGVGNDAAINDGGITLISSDTDSNKTILFKDATDSWTFNQHLFPSDDSQKNLGSSSIRWANGYFDTVYGAGNFTTITGSSTVNISSGALKVDTGNTRVGVNQATPLATLQVEKVGFDYNEQEVASSSTGTPIAVTLFDRTEFRAAKLLVEIDNKTDDVHETAEMVITTNGATGGTAATNAYLTTYAIVNSGGTNNGTYNVDVNGSNVELQVTPLTNGDNIVVKVHWQGLTI
tara:strand:+ start:4629 stop:7052 length:2424 start_codon:yes stop_codon:yes gene_type:complete